MTVVGGLPSRASSFFGTNGNHKTTDAGVKVRILNTYCNISMYNYNYITYV
jgi:hypothetical protein